MANEWKSPTGHIDPTGSWKDEQRAYDGEIGDLGANCGVPPKTWSNFLELTIGAIYCSKIRFFAAYTGTSGINGIDLDVYYNNSWHDVFQGSFLHRVWTEKSLGDTYYVTKMRMRFFNNGATYSSAAIWEAMFYETAGIPKVTTNAATSVESESATLNGSIIDTGGAVCIVRCFRYKEGISGIEVDPCESGTFGTGTFSKALTGLTADKVYYFKAYVANVAGLGWGEWLSFKTPLGEEPEPDIPTVTSSAATSVDHEKATLNGNITATGGEDPTERGFQWKIGVGGDIETLRETGTFGVGTYSLLLDELDANINYYFRAYAKNAGGTGYGSWLNFTTDITDPTVVTHNATEELTTQVTGNGEIVKTGGVDCDEVGFEYGLSKTPTWLKNEVAGGYPVGFFDLTIDGLTENTEYWYRAYAKRFV